MILIEACTGSIVHDNLELIQPNISGGCRRISGYNLFPTYLYVVHEYWMVVMYSLTGVIPRVARPSRVNWPTNRNGGIVRPEPCTLILRPYIGYIFAWRRVPQNILFWYLKP